MTKKEAMILAAKLELPIPRNGDHLLAMLAAKGLIPAVCHETGDWLVLDKDRNELARCA